ncbi:MAG TPA: bifunctional glutamate N-acetyltransferase/amino-acid acetyltransferase ArgJ [Solirubrobacteraceae bacterium]|nr:bifunctional glutamate N-acetyltransferase/amino-acid acetyltransferase ArgJ [Solirubrobacteraceae bacterium]
MSPFFASRWVAALDHVTELDADAGGLPEGFRAAGVAADIKPSGDPDVGLLVCDAPGVTSHAMFTRSGTQSAPVLVCRERCELDSIAAVVVNSGNANAATGSGGYDDALEMQRRAAEAAGVAPESVAVASTGVIGVPLPMERVSAGIDAAAMALAPDGDRPFSDAIQTTDAFEKRARVRVALPSGPVTITAQAKGAGMISPDFATLLCFVQTDAALSAETCELLLSVCVKRSFDRISVDGQLSTSDTVILQASGASGVVVEPESEDELRLGEAIDAITRQLALLVVRDGEGARRTGRVVVRGGEERTVQRVARAVANSPLVKAALYGGDPNWGRIAQAAGAAMPDTAPLALDISIEGIQLCSAGSFVPHDAHALAAAVAGDEVEYEIGLMGEGAEAEVYFSDLGHEYVTINAEYTT